MTGDLCCWEGICNITVIPDILWEQYIPDLLLSWALTLDKCMQPQSTFFVIRQQNSSSHTISMSVIQNQWTSKITCPSALLWTLLVRRSFLSELFSSPGTTYVALGKRDESGTAQVHLDSIKLLLTSIANCDYLLQHLLSPVIFQGFHYDVVGGPSCKTSECSTGGSARNPELQQKAMPSHWKGKSDRLTSMLYTLMEPAHSP